MLDPLPRAASKVIVALLVACFCVSWLPAQWVDYVDETATRLVAEPGVDIADAEEKDSPGATWTTTATTIWWSCASSPGPRQAGGPTCC